MADGYVGRVQRRCAAMAGVGLCLALAAPAWGAGALEDVDAQKAAVKCQTLIAKTTAKALATSPAPARWRRKGRSRSPIGS